MARACCRVQAGQASAIGRVITVGKAVVGAGLLILFADLAGQRKRGGVPRTGGAWPAGSEQGLTEAVECLGFAGPLADLAAQGEGPLGIVTGLLGTALQ